MDEVLAFPKSGFGILSRAEGEASPVVLVLLNAGLTHRVGPFRSYVHFARRLAASGVHVFRFDLPRVGDGPATGVSVDGMVTDAFDLLERHTGARRFVVGGICAAADLAWRLAPQDPRIAGVWLFDGFAHRGAWYALARLRRALRKPVAQWPALVRRVLGGVRTAAAGQPVSSLRDWQEPRVFRDQARQLLERGVRILAMYTGGVSSYLLHPAQLGQTFGRARMHPGLQVEYWPQLDHTLMSPADRDHVLRGLQAWFESSGLRGGPAPAG